MDQRVERRILSDTASPPEYSLSVTARDLVLRKQRWAQEDALGKKIPQPERLEPQLPEHTGRIIKIDRSGEIASLANCERVQGILAVNGGLIAAKHNALIKLDNNLDGESEFSSHYLFNDLHSIRETDRGFIVASTGTDSIFEVSQDGEVVWQWLATDHGYDRDSFGLPRIVDPVFDHRQMVYDTWINTTHVNSAVAIGQDRVLATLFHQGTVIEIDRHNGEKREISEGINRPHALRKLGTTSLALTLASTGSGEALVARYTPEGLQITERIAVETGWLQDCIRLKHTWLMVDGANARVIHTDRDGKPLVIDQFDENYLLYEAAVSESV